MKWFVTNNINGSVKIADIPVVGFGELHRELCENLSDPKYHVANYFATECGERYKFYCLLLNDATHEVMIASHECVKGEELESIVAIHQQMHPFEREITEKFGIIYKNSPWNKPLRFSFDRADKASTMDTYPFYKMEGKSLHEVNVGPIHAGIIEPGAFRFICNGERVLHLEIALGYQHRGVEALMTGTQNRIRQSALAESTAGDSTVAHCTAYSTIIEKFSGVMLTEQLQRERVIALELERMAMHIADTGALCMDVAYQLGQVACEALRTIVINTTQLWCGNRFAKSMIRPCGTFYPLTEELVATIAANVVEVERRYAEVKEDIKSSPSLLARFEECGTVSAGQMQTIGAVGMAARSSGHARDIRASHPWGAYDSIIEHESVIRTQGDVMARLMIRGREIAQSAQYILQLLDSFKLSARSDKPNYNTPLATDSLAFSLIEGWRGEICHTALTNTSGDIFVYKIKDPSVHNWLALALSVRDAGISDFPICNKSFNLSYCGHDL